MEMGGQLHPTPPANLLPFSSRKIVLSTYCIGDRAVTRPELDTVIFRRAMIFLNNNGPVSVKETQCIFFE